MADVAFGYVFDLGHRARSGSPAAARASSSTASRCPSRRRERRDAEGRLEVVAIESADPRWIAPAMDALEEHVHRIRAIGSVAISLCQVAIARVDGMVTLWRTRAVDARRRAAHRPRERRRRRVPRLRRRRSASRSTSSRTRRSSPRAPRRPRPAAPPSSTGRPRDADRLGPRRAASAACVAGDAARAARALAGDLDARRADDARARVDRLHAARRRRGRSRRPRRSTARAVAAS